MSDITTEMQTVESFVLRREMEIDTPIEIAFETVIDVLGPAGEMPGGAPYPMVLEPWPGGRWYRDLGDNNGHLWGHVQAIKAPTLIEIHGPLMMSLGATSNLQYRLTAEGDKTRLVFHHRAIGAMMGDYKDNLPGGWDYWLEHIRNLAEGKKK